MSKEIKWLAQEFALSPAGLQVVYKRQNGGYGVLVPQ